MIRFLLSPALWPGLHRVSGLLVERRRLLYDVRAIHFLRPLGGRDFFEGDGHRLVAVVQDRGDVLGDCLGEPAFLLLRLAWPEFDDDVRHVARSSFRASISEVLIVADL